MRHGMEGESMTNTVKEHDQRQALETSLQIKRAQKESYLKAAQACEEKAVEYRSIASEIARGIRRTMRAIQRLERKNEHF